MVARLATGTDEEQVHAELELELLGTFRVGRAGATAAVPPTSQEVVAFLALHPGAQRRSFVAANLWPAASEHRARANLRNALYRLERTLPGLTERVTDDIGIGATVASDLDQHEHIVTGEHRDPEVAISLLAQELLPGWHQDWVVVARERVRHRSVYALLELVERLGAAGRWPTAVEAGLAAVALDPLCEPAHRALTRAFARQGSLPQAIAHFQQYEHELRASTGLRPSSEYRDEVRSLRNQ